jgi:tRNA nucleotidyltransferase (CCA-adding enzyme)
VDPFGGREDLKKGLIRCVGEPSRRFDEDALRILRGVRFASVLGFAIEENTSRAIHAQMPLLAKVSIERISGELVKLLCGAGAAEVLTAFRDLVAFLLPELPEVPLGTRLQALASVPREPALRLAVLLADLPPHEAGKLLRRLRMENKLSLQVTALIREQRTLLTCTDTPCLLRLFRKFPPELAEALLTLTEALHGTSMAQMRGRVESLLASSPCLSVAQLAVGGKELMELGIPAGEKMGEALQMLLEGVTDGKWENSRDALLSAVKSWHSVC